jgi:ATPase subunit of ABC transporter with duplicated ATPase domains
MHSPTSESWPACARNHVFQGTLLVLDEPTNHLDIPSKETLEEAIRCFEGAVIAVSHDRYFLKRIATRVLLVSGLDECWHWY